MKLENIRYYSTLILIFFIGCFLAIDIMLWSEKPIFPFWISIVGMCFIFLSYGEASSGFLYNLIYNDKDYQNEDNEKEI